jgi:hypothetical protein
MVQVLTNAPERGRCGGAGADDEREGEGRRADRLRQWLLAVGGRWFRGVALPGDC